MKKLVCAILAATLMLAPAALAEQEHEITPQTGIVALENNTEIDLDADGTAETVAYELTEDDEGTGKFKITVGDAEITLDTYSGLKELYAGRLNGADDGIFLLVGEYGPSDDDYSYIVRYDGEALTQIGGIGALPADIAINGDVLTARVRADKLQTWFRESDFVIARSYLYDEDYNPLPAQYYVAESPRASYTMDTVAVLKRDLPLKTSLFGEGELELKAGETVILTATDDKSYVYITPADMAAHDWAPGGYLMLGSGFDEVLIDGEAVSGADVFDGLIYAD